MSQFERACEELESMAQQFSKAARQADRIAGQLRKAGEAGDHAKIQAARDQLREALVAVGASGHRAADCWPFDDASLQRFLEADYERELVALAKSQRLELHAMDDRLVAFPVVLQLQPTQRSVRISGKRTAALRPSRVLDAVRRQTRNAGTRPQQFIEMLYRAYHLCTRTGEMGARLADLFETLTLHPETRRSYGAADFARDLYLLDSSDVSETRSGARVSFPAATGTKAGRGVYTVIPSSGMPKQYYGIRFEEKEAAS
ncbi:hypothetical protein KJ059_16815 [Myxococcota bacterium]|nr:hypothetical protein [Myxococcota bacterium]MCZ7620324.1 hypothetical protein [Myxococcota bacterium]